MLDTGIVRRIDELGRIVIPVELRRRLAIGDRERLHVHLDGDAIVLRKPDERCVFCGGDEELVRLHERHACAPCRVKLME